MSGLSAIIVEPPLSIGVSADLASLEVTRGDGAEMQIGADRLRNACKCAHCLRARIDGRFSTGPGLAIVNLAFVGGYAVNLSFSDGHNRGIYPWHLLYSLAEEPA